MRPRHGLPILTLLVLAGCAPAVNDEGVADRGPQGSVSVGVGPDDAAIAYGGRRVVAGVGTDHQVAAGVRVGNAPMVVGVETQERRGLFGGLGFAF